MPTELLRIASGLRWEQTTIRRGEAGLETEILFEVAGQPFAVTLDSMPRGDFLLAALDVYCLSISERSFEERGWIEAGRYEISLGYDGERRVAALADRVNWMPISPA